MFYGRRVPETWRHDAAWQGRPEPARAWPFDQVEAQALSYMAMLDHGFVEAFIVYVALLCTSGPANFFYRVSADFGHADNQIAIIITSSG